MSFARIVALSVAILMFGSNSFGNDITPRELLKKVAATYETMETYKAEGTVTSDIDVGGMKVKIETSFSILLKKPNLYLISWTQRNMPMPGMIQSGAVWSDGTHPYLYMGIMNAYSKMNSDELALGGATGISSGAAFTIPSLFLSSLKKQPTPFSQLKDPLIEGTEKVGKEDCYVISSPSTISKKETFWISKESYVIIKYKRSLELPSGGRKMPEMSDEQLEEAIKGMGQEVTKESKKNMRKMMESSGEMLATVNMTGSFTELHESISSPELTKSNFAYAVPKDAVLKDSLFGEMFGGSKAISNRPDGSDTRPGSDDREVLIDRAGLLTREQRNEIHDILDDHNKKGPGKIFVLTTDELPPNTSIEDYAFAQALERLSAPYEKNDHILLVVALKNRKVRIEASPNVSPLVPDDFCKKVIDERIVPRFKEAEYYAGIRAGIISLIDKLKQ